MGNTLTRFVDCCDVLKHYLLSSCGHSSICKSLSTTNYSIANNSGSSFEMQTAQTDFAPIRLEDFDVFLNETHNVVSRHQQPQFPV